MRPDYETLVGSIYDCAANPELWPTALGAIRDSVGGAYALTGFVDMTDVALGRPPYIKKLHSGWDEEWLHKLDVILNNLPGGGGLTNTEVDQSWTQLTRVPEVEFQTSEFYLSWVKPQGLRDTINTPYLQRSTMVGMLSIPCYATRDPYTAAECHLIERLSPHVRRVMLINDIADKGQMALALYRNVLDTLSAAVFLVGLGRRLVFTNAAGDGLLADGGFLKMSNGCLQANRVASLPSALDDAIDRALKGDTAIGISGIGVPLIGRDGERLAAYVLPISGKDIRGELGRGHCAVFIAKRGEQQPMAMEILRTIFDLTVSEARIALLLAKGDGPQVIADSLNVSVNTVRSHLKHAYAKTETSDQAGLGALVNKFLPPIAEK
jgi:DNA-binding CsgD family transcriptional regulator